MERRIADTPVAVERRAERRHGTRTMYQAGCVCLPCRAANAAYEADYRDRKRRGVVLLGAVVDAPDAMRQLRLLVVEYETAAALARRFGFQDRHIQYGRWLTVRSLVRIRRRYQADILSGLEGGNDGNTI